MFLNFARSIFSQVLSVYVESPYLESPVAIGNRKASINCKPENFVPNTGSKIERGHICCLLTWLQSIKKKKTTNSPGYMESATVRTMSLCTFSDFFKQGSTIQCFTFQTKLQSGLALTCAIPVLGLACVFFVAFTVSNAEKSLP